MLKIFKKSVNFSRAGKLERWIEEFQTLFSEASCSWRNYVKDYKLQSLHGGARAKGTKRHERSIPESMNKTSADEFESLLPFQKTAKIAMPNDEPHFSSQIIMKAKRSLVERLDAIKEQFEKIAEIIFYLLENLSESNQNLELAINIRA